MEDDDDRENFADNIEHTIEDEAILGIVIGQLGHGYDDDKRTIPSEKMGKVLTWDEAKPMLDYKYDSGYGSPDCHAITVWTNKYVYFIVRYDGSTSINRVPRNPIDHMPEMPGG